MQRGDEHQGFKDEAEDVQEESENSRDEFENSKDEFENSQDEFLEPAGPDAVDGDGATAAAGSQNEGDSTDSAGGAEEGADDPATELEKAKSEAAEHYDRYLRAAAELDNYRKRTVKMRAESREETIRDILLQIAPMLDNMRRALSQERADAAAIIQGVGLIFNQFQDILKGYGLEEIVAAGERFDPNVHEAMLEVESDEHSPGTVIEEMEKGYKLRDKVLRPARVVVSKAVSGGQSGDEGSGGDSESPDLESESTDTTEST